MCFERVRFSKRALALFLKVEFEMLVTAVVTLKDRLLITIPVPLLLRTEQLCMLTM